MIKNIVLHIIVIFAMFVAFDAGFISLMFSQDVTYITSAMVAAYVWLSARIWMEPNHPDHWFYADSFLPLGMIGTVIGFLIVFSTSLSGFTIGDNAAMLELIKSMSIGIATALWTTLMGLVCSLLLKVQITNASDE